MAKPIKTQFIPKNPRKYMGPNRDQIISRSSWEHHMMMVFDNHPDVIQWSSETIQIPYKNPFTLRWTVYIPDFLVFYRDRKNKIIKELIEVKPREHLPGYRGAVSRLVEAAQIVNAAKWDAARVVCNKNHWRFRIIADDEMFKMRRYNPGVGA